MSAAAAAAVVAAAAAIANDSPKFECPHPIMRVPVQRRMWDDIGLGKIDAPSPDARKIDVKLFTRHASLLTQRNRLDPPGHA